MESRAVLRCPHCGHVIACVIQGGAYETKKVQLTFGAKPPIGDRPLTEFICGGCGAWVGLKEAVREEAREAQWAHPGL